jgi:hypothetical protein
MVAIKLKSSLNRKSLIANQKSSITRRLAETGLCGYIARMSGLTRQEILVLSIIAGLLLTGRIVKFYRDSHPPAAVQSAKN